MDFGYGRYPFLGMLPSRRDAYDLNVWLGILLYGRRNQNWNNHEQARRRFCRRQWA